MKRIISFSLWGNNEKYTIGAIENAILAQELYPEWICRFYIGQTTRIGSPNVISRLDSLSNTELVFMDENGNWNSTFWRFTACSDPAVEYVLCRDCDSRLSIRERNAVEEWIQSEKVFHIMRDHPWHEALILAGLWGCRCEGLRDINELVKNYIKTHTVTYSADQDFLRTVIFPRIKNSCFIHDEFHGGRKFPLKRRNLEFIGQVYDPANERTFEHREVLKTILDKRKPYNKIKYVLRSIYRSLKVNKFKNEK